MKKRGYYYHRVSLVFYKVSKKPEYPERNISVQRRKPLANRSFPSSPGPLYQNEVKCSALVMEMIFHSHANKTHFQKKGCALGLILKVRVFGTRTWPIQSAYGVEGRIWTQTTSVCAIALNTMQALLPLNVSLKFVHQQNQQSSGHC